MRIVNEIYDIMDTIVFETYQSIEVQEQRVYALFPSVDVNQSGILCNNYCLTLIAQIDFELLASSLFFCNILAVSFCALRRFT